jgi:hypothetical protein
MYLHRSFLGTKSAELLQKSLKKFRAQLDRFIEEYNSAFNGK